MTTMTTKKTPDKPDSLNEEVLMTWRLFGSSWMKSLKSGWWWKRDRVLLLRRNSNSQGRMFRLVNVRRHNSHNNNHNDRRLGLFNVRLHNNSSHIHSHKDRRLDKLLGRNIRHNSNHNHGLDTLYSKPLDRRSRIHNNQDTSPQQFSPAHRPNGSFATHPTLNPSLKNDPLHPQSPPSDPQTQANNIPQAPPPRSPSPAAASDSLPTTPFTSPIKTSQAAFERTWSPSSTKSLATFTPKLESPLSSSTCTLSRLQMTGPGLAETLATQLARSSTSTQSRPGYRGSMRMTCASFISCPLQSFIKRPLVWRTLEPSAHQGRMPGSLQTRMGKCPGPTTLL